MDTRSVAAAGIKGIVGVVGGSFLAGCELQWGLANVAGLPAGSPNGTPEAPVHDVIANGHDACGRSSGPPGGVLRGQIPPCGPETAKTAVTLVPGPPSARALHVCPGPEPTASPADQGLVAYPSTRPRLWLACDPP